MGLGGTLASWSEHSAAFFQIAKHVVNGQVALVLRLCACRMCLPCSNEGTLNYEQAHK